MLNPCSLRKILLVGLVISPGAYALDIPTAQQALTTFGIGGDQIAKLNHGEIVAYDVDETSNKELGIGLAMIIPLPLPKVAEAMQHGYLTAIDSDTVASGSIPDNADISAFKKFAFTAKQLDEAKSLLEAEPGDEFNLSAPEIDAFNKLAATLEDADDKTILSSVSQKYRELLLQRWQQYRKNGLSGIAVYNRGGTKADPATELKTDAAKSKAWAQYYPELQQAWLNYPAKLPDGATEQFTWLNRSVENRPTPILNHRIIAVNDNGGMILSRQFYVGHSYNSSQVVAGGLSYQDGTLVFYSTRSSTDQVAGIGSSLKHSIGREQMKKEMIKNLQRLNKALKKSTKT